MTKLNPTQENFSGAVQSFTNTGSAGGTFYYVNLGGIKILFGETAAYATATTAQVVNGITLPTNFFTSVNSVSATASNQTNEGRQFASVLVYSATSISIGITAIATVAGATSKATIFVIGT